MSQRFVLLLPLVSALGCGDGSDPQAPDNEGVTCGMYAKHVSEVCGSEESTLADSCENDRDRYEPMGCGPELASYYRCLATSDFDCDSGEGCPGSETYGRCVSSFVTRTNCSRQPQNDDMCDSDEYAFNCLADLPSGCAKKADSTLGTLACCASFAKGKSPFE
jgi:hypothetical protein